MPNWCYSSYYFEFAEEDTAKRFTEVLEKASKVTPRGQDFGAAWLGNILIACGRSYHFEKSEYGHEIIRINPDPSYRYKGSITWFERDKQTVEVETETAWCPNPGVLATALLHVGVHFDPSSASFEDVNITWCAEESGCEIYVGSDAETCEGDIHVQLECNEEKYKTDKRFQEIFCYDDCWEDDGTFVQEFSTYRESLIEDINRLVSPEEKQDTLEGAVEALKRAYPDYDIKISVTPYEFYELLSDDEVTEITDEQDKMLEEQWDELSDIPFDEDEEGTLHLSWDWNGFNKF